MADTPNLREADKPDVMLYLADCGSRDGLDETQQKQLTELRLGLAAAIEADDRTQMVVAQTALFQFYEALPEIKNGEFTMIPARAVTSDVERLTSAVRQYSPNHEHPRYWGM